MNTSKIKNILQNNDFSKEGILELLETSQSEAKLLFQKAKEVKSCQIGDKVYLRGLIEFSNMCVKDCLYCGIRKSNKNVERYFYQTMKLFRQQNLLFLKTMLQLFCSRVS